MQPNEETRPILGFHGYSISKSGQVYSTRNSVNGSRKPVKTRSNGQVTLCRGAYDRKQRPVRLLLLETWGSNE